MLSPVRLFATPDSCVHGISQGKKILQWAAIPSSRGIFQTQRSNLRLLHWQILYRRAGHLGSPAFNSHYKTQEWRTPLQRCFLGPSHSPCPTYPDSRVHPSGGQPVDPPGGSILEIQAVHRLLVVPGDLASDDFHPPGSSRSETQFLRGWWGVPPLVLQRRRRESCKWLVMR